MTKLRLSKRYMALWLLTLTVFSVGVYGEGTPLTDIGGSVVQPVRTTCASRTLLRSFGNCPLSFTLCGEALIGGGESGQRPSKSKSKWTTLGDTLTALRPWTWTAGIIPVLLTASLLHGEEGLDVDKAGLVKALVMVITLQSAGNLVNSVEDFKHGVDKWDSAGDRTIVDGYVDPLGAFLLAAVLMVTAVAAVIPTILTLRAAEDGGARDLEMTFFAGVGMVFSYTSWPLRLKYRGLGDITVFLLFGPMLMQVASLMICGKGQSWIFPYGVPAALLCEAVLHANNMRDIQQDQNAGITTLATTIGFRASQALYWSMIMMAYGVAGLLALLDHRGCTLAFLTIPLATAAIRNCKIESIRNLDEMTAKLHMLFGVLMTAGTLLF